MQIEGAREFFSNLAALTRPAAGARGSPLSNAASPLQMFLSDKLDISDIGKRLSLQTEKAPLLNGKEIRMEDKLLDRVENVLEQMHKLAVAAQSTELTDGERVNMQIEFEELREQLGHATAPGIYGKNAGYLEETLYNSDKLRRYAGDGTNLLERMQNRIANGEEWNVREAFDPESGKWRVVNESNKNIQKRVIDEDAVLVGTKDTGKVVPTVREQLESQSQVVLMDAKSAADGAELIENQIKKVQGFRIRFLESLASNEKDPKSGPSLAQLFLLRHEFLANNPVKSLGGQIGGRYPEFVFGSYGRVYELFPDEGPAFDIQFREIRAEVNGSFLLIADIAEQLRSNAVAFTPYYRNNILSEAPLNTIEKAS